MWINKDIFIKHTLNYFELLTEYDMSIVANEVEECVRYESNNTWLEVWFDRHSLFVEMGEKAEGNELSLWDIVEYMSRNGKDVLFMASTEEKLIIGLNKLSQYVKDYCREALYGDVEFFKRIRTSLAMQRQQKSVMTKNRHIEGQAKDAWNRRDYKKVIDLYQTIKDNLTPVQKKRLIMSIRRINQECK